MKNEKFRLKVGWLPTSAIKIMLLPFITLIFLIGWLCYIIGDGDGDGENDSK